MKYLKSISKRIISLALTFAIVLVMIPFLPVKGFAATSGTLAEMPDGLEVTWQVSSDQYATVSQNTTAGTATFNAKTESGCSDTSHTVTVTFKNTKSIPAVLSFTYTLTLNSGTITIDGASATAAGNFSKEVAAGKSITISVKSGSTSNTSLVIKAISFFANVDATTTFIPAENGSYTVDGAKITEQTTKTKNSSTAYKLVATPAEGYKFSGWYSVNEEKYLSEKATFTINIDSEKTITAHFIPADACQFTVGAKRITGLAEAINYAKSSNIKTIVLHSSTGTVPAGDYTIPSGYTLLIPDNEAENCYRETPTTSTNSNTSKVSDAFRTLTLASGANINVLGSISVGGIMKSAQGGPASTLLGKYGLINMLPNSNIVLQNGANLYAWGIITGEGTVTAKSGSKVYEWFQIVDFRGGSATSTIVNKKSAFPFSQYYVQDIEANFVLEAGATEQVYASLFFNSDTHNTSVDFVGQSGLFNITSGKLTRKYDGSTDRIEYKFDGTAEINSISVTIIAEVNSAEYILPITNNIKLCVSSGSVTLNQNTCLPAGVELTVENGAELLLPSGKSLYLYDNTEWVSKDYVYGSAGTKFKSLPFAYSRTYTRTVANDLPDAKLCLDGTLNLKGSLYTTASGADITSNSSGKIAMQSAPGTKTETVQFTQSGTDVTSESIPITVAKLHNADDTYVETASASAGDNYYYFAGKWVKNPTTATVTAKDWGGNTAKTITIDATNGTSFESIKPLLENVAPPDEYHEACYWRIEGGNYLEDTTVLNTNVTIVPEYEWSVIVPTETTGAGISITESNEEKYITGIDLSSNNVSDLEANIQCDSTQLVIEKDGKVLSDTDTIGTGCVVKCVSAKDNSVVYDTATVVIYGDVDGDGAIDGFDAVELDLANNKAISLSSAASKASDVNGDGAEMTTADYAFIVSSVQCKNSISQAR